VHDLRDSITRQPPWGDHVGLDPETDGPIPLILQTSGGTTGLPRPMIYTPRDREVMNIMSGRRLYTCGVRPYDVVQVTLSLGLSNGGFLNRESLWKYTGAIPVMTGSGAATSTRRQIEIMKAWGVNVLIGFPAYLRHMARIARDEMNIDPAELKLKAVMTHLGVDDRREIESRWNAPVFDGYGTNGWGAIAVGCVERWGMDVFEDGFVVEINDPETLRPMPLGEKGTVFLTALFKHAAPVIRFNVSDISSFLPGACACGGTHIRMDRIFGRSDNMVKLRGVNIFPDAIGALVTESRGSNGEYVCVVEHAGEERRDTMTVLVEAANAAVNRTILKDAIELRLKEALGIKIGVDIVDAGALDLMTGLSHSSKIKRVIDKRNG
jgi:phenylacetate-CoA ligase